MCLCVCVSRTKNWGCCVCSACVWTEQCVFSVGWVDVCCEVCVPDED